MEDKIIEQLEAQATVADAEPEELTVVAESKVEEAEAEVEELQSENNELENEVSELQDQVEEKDSEIEELQDEVEAVSEMYAEELSDAYPAFEQDELMERYDVSELRQKFDALEDEEDEEEEELSSDPSPDSGDAGPNIQSPDEATEEASEVEAELSEEEEVAADAFDERGGVWSEIADDIRNE